MVYFLAVCENYSFLSVILFVKELMEIICIFTPIILIVMASIEVGKVVINPDPKVIKSVTGKTIQKVISAVGVFFIPTLVGILASMLGIANFNATDCWSNANSATIKKFKEANEIEKKAEQEKKDAEKAKAEDERKIVKATREAARKENAKAAEAAREASKNSSGNASDMAARLIQIAQQEYNSHPGNSPNKYTYAYGSIGGYGYAWCAAFVWWCSNEAGVYPNKVTLKSAAVNAYISHFQSGANGVHYEKSANYGGNYVPKMGDYIFFSGNHDPGFGTHIGLVKGISSDKVLIIDGNCSGTVCDRSLSLSDGYIIGYGVWE